MNTNSIVLAILAVIMVLVGSPANASDRDGFIVEPELSYVTFDDGILSGSTYSEGLNVAYAFNSRYEIGFNYSSNQLFPLVLLDLTKLDQSSSEVDEHELEVESKTLYARLNWSVNENATVFVMLGKSDYELKNENVRLNTFFFIPVGVSTTTTYRNKASATSVGLGLQWRKQNNKFVTLKYIDHSDSNFDYSTLHLGLRYVFDTGSAS